MCGTGVCPTQACLQLGERQVRICERKSGDGETVWEEVHASPIRRPSGAIAQVVEVWRDISERRAAEARLAESHRLASLGMLASGFSHELNTPLATVLACVEGIQRTAQAGDGDEAAEWRRVEESARVAREQLLRCRGITQHFLRLSRGQGSPGDLVDLGPTLAAVAQLIEPTARAHSVAVQVEPVEGQLRVRVNEAELQQVLLNLSLNAVQACEKGGRVVLGASGDDPDPHPRRGRRVRHPAGDPEEDLRAVLQRPARRDGARALPVPGLRPALGRRHRGPEHARVGVHLRGGAAPGGTRHAPAGHPVKPHPTLLLVDDDETFRRVMAGELERLGFEIAGAGSGEEAVQAAAKLEPEVVLLDLQLPDMDGLQVLQAIREKSPGSEVIMLTGHGSFDTAIQSIRMGAFDYVAKPCPLDELEVRIQRALERRALQQRATSPGARADARRTRAAPSSGRAPRSGRPWA